MEGWRGRGGEGNYKRQSLGGEVAMRFCLLVMWEAAPIVSATRLHTPELNKDNNNRDAKVDGKSP